MSKNPFLNAGSAALYIILLVTIIQFGSKRVSDQPDTILAPISMISLFTLSAGVMGYLFLSEPIQMFLSGEKKKAVTLFTQTLGVFGGLTIIALILAFSGVL